MKLLFVLTYYYPHWTGLTQYAQRVAEGLVKMGNQVSVLTVLHQSGLKRKEAVNGVKVSRARMLGRFSRTIVSLELFLLLTRMVPKNEAVVVYLPMAEVLLVALFAKLLGKRLFLVHNGDLVLPQGPLNRLMEYIFYVTTGWAIKISDGVLIQTEDYARSSALLCRFPEKWRVVLPLFPPVAEDKRYRRQLSRQFGRQQIVGFAGRFVEEKGFDYLLKAIPLVCRKHPEVVFAFAGETRIPYENFYQKNAALVEKVKSSLVFLGLLNRSQMETFYRYCQLLVISSRTDCFPSAQIEALLAGTPAVVADIPGARWPVSQTGMGVVVPKGKVPALAEGIIKVLNQRPAFASRVKEVKRIFDYETTLKAYQSTFAKRA